ncbi:unnamed protein product [Pleuronectes platessa]|uniref:Uncharacterized protein n=1 Tax=Pleuronectes platessa TaxID=8262 RepID=A0A9N7V6V2_PLEPL|nr:unnamed protein product [Pleuronectes platessa]
MENVSHCGRPVNLQTESNTSHLRELCVAHRHLPPRPNWTSCLLRLFQRKDPEHRDGHTAYNPAPHLGYELANRGLNTVAVGPMTMPHLGSRPVDPLDHRSAHPAAKRL